MILTPLELSLSEAMLRSLLEANALASRVLAAPSLRDARAEREPQQVLQLSNLAGCALRCKIRGHAEPIQLAPGEVVSVAARDLNSARDAWLQLLQVRGVAGWHTLPTFPCHKGGSWTLLAAATHRLKHGRELARRQLRSGHKPQRLLARAPAHIVGLQPARMPLGPAVPVRPAVVAPRAQPAEARRQLVRRWRGVGGNIRIGGGGRRWRRIVRCGGAVCEATPVVGLFLFIGIDELLPRCLRTIAIGRDEAAQQHARAANLRER